MGFDYEECRGKSVPRLSPVSDFANRLLHADKNSGNKGLLVRVVGKNSVKHSRDDQLAIFHEYGVMLDPPIPEIQYIPSSYLHASMRASNAIFDEVQPEGFAIMIGTKFANNTSMKRFQSSDKSVGCDHVYPTDGASFERASLLGRDFCWDAKITDVCVDGECLARGPMACGGCRADPERYGELVSQWTETVVKARQFVPWYFACYYETFEDAVIASNSLWSKRQRWKRDPHPLAYEGHTECASSTRIAEIDMADAVVITLNRSEKPTLMDICDFPEFELLEKRFQLIYERGYGDLPVLWYRESQGIRNLEECTSLFDGKGCKDSWHKEFVSQEIILPNKSCVFRPPGCDEAYYFKADGEQCSAHTEMGVERIDRLCRDEKMHDARLAWLDMRDERDSTMKSSDLVTTLELINSSLAGDQNRQRSTHNYVAPLRGSAVGQNEHPNQNHLSSSLYFEGEGIVKSPCSVARFWPLGYVLFTFLGMLAGIRMKTTIRLRVRRRSR